MQGQRADAVFGFDAPWVAQAPGGPRLGVQIPGTWLPLVLERDGAAIELVARLPAAPEDAPEGAAEGARAFVEKRKPVFRGSWWAIGIAVGTSTESGLRSHHNRT